MPTRWPDFLVVGAQKAGTTSLYAYLCQHPQIFLSDRKEARFFSEMRRRGGPEIRAIKDAVRTPDDYLALFARAREGQVVGDVSPDYFCHADRTIANIRKYVSHDPRIAIILRHPAERAYSGYAFFRLVGHEPLGFEDALDAEEERRRDGWAWPFWYAENSRYVARTRAFLDAFPNVKVLLTDDLDARPGDLMRELYGFLGVAPGFRPGLWRRYNKSGRPASRLFHRFMTTPGRLKTPLGALASRILFPFSTPEGRGHRFRRLLDWIAGLNLSHQPMRPATRARLIETFRDDVIELQDLLGRDLGAWLR